MVTADVFAVPLFGSTVAKHHVTTCRDLNERDPKRHSVI